MIKRYNIIELITIGEAVEFAKQKIKKAF
jgi:hypothetical protein